jgi:hypothetical protein
MMAPHDIEPPVINNLPNEDLPNGNLLDETCQMATHGTSTGQMPGWGTESMDKRYHTPAVAGVWEFKVSLHFYRSSRAKRAAKAALFALSFSFSTNVLVFPTGMTSLQYQNTPNDPHESAGKR